MYIGMEVYWNTGKLEGMCTGNQRYLGILKYKHNVYIGIQVGLYWMNWYISYWNTCVLIIL